MTRFLSCIKAAVIVAAVGGTALVAQAEAPVDLGVVVPGEVYEYPAFTTVTAQYTPSQTGPVRILYSHAPLGLYTSPTYDSEFGGQFSYVGSRQMMAYSELQEGVTYYLMGFTMDSGTMQIIEGATDIEVKGVSPEVKEGDYFSVSSNYTIDVAFNTPVTLTNALILVGDNRSTVNYTVSNAYVTCDVASPIMKMYHDGNIKKGDILTLRLVGVADAYDANNKYNGNGKYEVEFLMPDKPGELVKVINASLSDTNNPFLSYYAANDPAGVISFEFDTPLADDGKSVAKITYGNPDEIEIGVYVEDVPGVNSGNTASFDFCGKLRRPIDMLPSSTSSTQPANFSIRFANIYTEDGQRVFTNRQTNQNGFSLSFRINTLQYTISTDYTPGRGSKLEAGEEMEIWVMNGSYVYSSGIKFDYIMNGDHASLTIPMSEVNVEPDPIAAEDMIYTFKIPALNSDPDTKVTISFADAECADGLDHSKELTAEFGYDTTGVEGIPEADSNIVTVYNAAGICVLKNAGRSALANLPSGLYIVNGKKIIK